MRPAADAAKQPRVSYGSSHPQCAGSRPARLGAQLPWRVPSPLSNRAALLSRFFPLRSWLGHGTIWVLNLHAVLYYIAWGIQRE